MNIREINKPVTAASLNESLAKRFGKRIALENFTLEQLQDVRNKLRTQLSQVETNESFDTVSTSETYQKNKLFLDVLNAEIAERSDVDEETLSKAEADAKKKKGIALAAKRGEKVAGAVLKKLRASESVIREGAEDQAELVMAAKDMVDRLTGWMEDTAEMQTESMLELSDAIRDEMGQEQSDAFVAAVKPALEQLYAAMESTRTALTGGVGQLTGEAQPETMGAEEPEMEPTVDMEGGEEEFGAAEAAAGGEEEAGRAKRESINRKRKMLETSRRLGTILSKKK